MTPSKYILVFDIQIKTRCVKQLKYTFISKWQWNCKPFEISVYFDCFPHFVFLWILNTKIYLLGTTFLLVMFKLSDSKGSTQDPLQGQIQTFFGDTVFWNGNFSLPTPWLPGSKKIKTFNTSDPLKTYSVESDT